MAVGEDVSYFRFLVRLLAEGALYESSQDETFRSAHATYRQESQCQVA